MSQFIAVIHRAVFAGRGVVLFGAAGLLLCALLSTSPAWAQVPCCLDELEEDVEEDIVDEVEDAVTDRVDETVEETIEDNIEDRIQDTIDDRVEETVADTVEESVEEEVSDSVEESVADNVEDAVEDRVEESVADNVEGAVEESVEESVAGSVEESVEESVAQSVESSVEESVTDAVETSTEETVAQSVESTVEASVEDAVGDTVEASVEGAVAGVVEERLESEIDSIVDQLESKLEIDEGRIATEQWLVMAEPEVFDELAEQGYLFDRVTDLPGMGLMLAEVAAPSSFEISEVRQGVLDVVGSGRAEVDMNHLYTASAPVEHKAPGVAPREVMAMPEDTQALPLRLGMIDSQVDVGHPALSGARISSRSFVGEGVSLPSSHGTAIASILAGRDDEGYQGLAPNAELYTAAVFEEDADRGEIASTVSLVRALDWLMSSGVDVVNVSLAGPPNRLLERALERAAERNVLILAAAGNGGPMAAPMYPAAYPSVMAITAVDADSRVFRLANRGNYLDIAAPGVGLVHANAEGGYTTSSGTSFAVPFAATAAARLRHTSPSEDIRELLIRDAEDLGAPGYDEIYGYGLLRVGG